MCAGPDRLIKRLGFLNSLAKYKTLSFLVSAELRGETRGETGIRLVPSTARLMVVVQKATCC